jgi:hypothetical protein
MALDCPEPDMELCDDLLVPSAGNDPLLVMDLWANSYKLCRLKQAGLVTCIHRFNKAAK